jgi:hypothetical protein
VSYPPGTLSISEAVNWLASREHDESAYWYAVHGGAWRKICEAVRTGKLPGYIRASGQSHKADPAQFALWQDYISIQIREPEFVAETAKETIHFSPSNLVGFNFSPAPIERRLSGPLFFVESELEAAFPEKQAQEASKMRQDILQAAEELWPYGIPEGLSVKVRDDDIRKHLDKKGLGKPSSKTIQRAFRGK